MAPHERVVVTGVGLVTAVGVGREAWRNLLQGRCAIRPVESFDTGRHASHIGAEIRGFDARLGVSGGRRATAFAIAAARQAIADAGLDAGAGDPHRAGVTIGTTSGEPVFIEQLEDGRAAGGPDDVQLRNLVVQYPSHTIPADVAQDLGFLGPAFTLPNACAAGNYAIAAATGLLRAGRTDVMLAGGADAFS